jgi:hypothetical protein
MLDIGNPFVKSDVLQALQTVDQTISDYFAALSPEAFFAHPPEVWSPAENLQHLIQSVSPIVRALQIPREKLAGRFGLADRPSQPYADMVAQYKGLLTEGVQATGQYIPVLDGLPTDGKAGQEQIVANWRQVCDDLAGALDGWGEAELDSYQLPHPALGVLTMRDMLFFTLYHNQHHLNDTKRLFEAA